MKNLKKIFLTVLLLTGIFVQGQTPPTKTRILFILDASQSMLGQWEGKQKIKIATSLLSNLMDSLKHVKNVGVKKCSDRNMF